MKENSVQLSQSKITFQCDYFGQTPPGDRSLYYELIG